MKKHLLYFAMVFKAQLHIIPRLLFTTLVLGVLGFLLILAGKATMQTKSASKLSIAVVMPAHSDTVKAAFQLVTDMDSLKDTCTFTPHYDDLEGALVGLERGEYAAVCVITKDTIISALDGSNIPAQLILPHHAGAESAIFMSLITSGVRTFSYVQAGIYSVHDLFALHGASPEKLQAIDQDTNLIYGSYVLFRTNFFEVHKLSSMGEFGVLGFYYISALLLLLFCIGLCFVPEFVALRRDHADSLKLSGISSSEVLWDRYLSMTFLIWCVGSLLYVFSGIFMGFVSASNLGIGLVSLFAISASLSSLYMLMARAGDAGLASITILFLLGLLMLYVCGRLLPIAYLPNAFRTIRQFLPVTYWADLIEHCLGSTLSRSSLGISMAYGLVAYLLGWWITRAKEVRGQ